MPKYKFVPKTINDAVNVLIPMFNGMDDYFNKYNERQFISFCNSQLSGGIGMNIRNMFSLWTNQNTSLYKEFLDKNIDHPDDMSYYLIKLIYQKNVIPKK